MISSKDISVAPDDTPFWQFSGSVYGRRGVAEACLALQERHRLDVNLLLFCAWAGSNGRRLDGGDLGLLRSAVRPWHDQVVAPLRQVRRWLKQQTSVPEDVGEAFREEVKALELQAEMLEQLMLYQEHEVAPGDGAPEDVAANLLLYLTRFKPRPTDDDIADLAAILHGACPEVAPVHAIRILEDGA
ncbi:MAG TPA: TIGR02444 family protein [Kiloniellaceae bacterium]|nr:TIGR02444 family protein [Kiloniellaceae bacterium]